MEREEKPGTQQVPRDNSLARGLYVVFGTILVGIVASVALVKLEQNAGARQSANTSPPAVRWVPTEPESMTTARDDVFGPALTEVRKNEDEHLQSYGWVDPKLKVVRVPIDRAMEILLKQDAEAAAPAKDEKKQDEKKPVEKKP